MNRTWLTFIVFILLFSTAHLAHSRELTKQQKLDDFRQLTGIINANYGPLEYKMSNGIVDVPALNARFEQQVQSTASNRDFYYKLVQYVAAYKDGHFGIRVPSRVVVSVPVATDLVDGRVLITKIDRNRLPQAKFPFAVGDEVVSVDGVGIADYLTDLGNYVPSGNPMTVRRIASWSVFFRRGERMPVPVGQTLRVEIKSAANAAVSAAELKWDTAGTPIDEGVPNLVLARVDLGESPFSVNFDRVENTAFQPFVPALVDRDFMCSGGSRIVVPADAKLIMTTPFVAYYHPTAKGNVGYLRIPHYSPPAQPGKAPTDVAMEWMAQYQFAIRELEKNTVGLIIDQDHNCGGSVAIAHQTIALFAREPFAPTQFELLANKESYLNFREWVEETPDFTVDRENVERVLKLVKETWENGSSFLTPKIAIDGTQMVEPASMRYTKPIVMLIDEISGSGGDMFPSMMKGIGRAKLFGQRTSGLGGHVVEYPAALSNSQMRFRMTKSLFYRPDGVAIENNGAVPDRFYTITRNDVLGGFKDYQKAYLQYLSEQL